MHRVHPEGELPICVVTSLACTALGARGANPRIRGRIASLGGRSDYAAVGAMAANRRRPYVGIAVKRVPNIIVNWM